MICSIPKTEEKPGNITFNEYAEFAATTDQPNPDPAAISPPWVYYMVGIERKIKELSKMIKRKFWDQNGAFTNEDKRLIGLEIGDILWYLTRLAAVFGFSLAAVAARNMLKLAGQLEQNKIQGSGDGR